MSEEPEVPKAPQTKATVAVVVQKAYDLTLWLLPKVEKFPRSFRFSVGERIVAAALDLLLLLVDASYARQKDTLLVDANRRVNALRFLLRLSNDLRLLPEARYAFASQRLDEVGRMVGGWLRAAR